MYQTSLGHAHLCVRNLKRSVAFYRKYLGLRLTEIAAKTAFMTSGGPHHELALWELGMKASRSAPGAIGLNHLAFDVLDKRSFGLAYRKLIQGGIAVEPVDHGIGWGAYFKDPDGNGLEIYYDARTESDGRKLWRGTDRPLTRERILAAIQAETRGEARSSDGLPPRVL